MVFADARTPGSPTTAREEAGYAGLDRIGLLAPAYYSNLTQYALTNQQLERDRLDRDFDLSWFMVRKKVDGRPAIQFERLVGQISAFVPTHYLEVPREGVDGRFLPIKDPSDLERRAPMIRELMQARGVL